MTTRDTAGVVIRPPLLFGGVLLAALALGWFAPLSFAGAAVSPVVRIAAGCVVAAGGVVLLVAAARSFASVGTPVPTWRPSVALAMSGPYRWSRNPIYLALTAIYLGIAVAADNAWAVILLIPVLAVLRFGVIAREERYLERRFGAAYAEYRARVRRWL